MDAFMGGFTSLMGGVLNEALFAGPARRKYNAQMEYASEERFKREKEAIDKHNIATEREQGRVLGAKEAVAYRTSVVQMADARRQAQRFQLLSQDFLNEVKAQKAQQVVAYAGSGALIQGSALIALRETQQRGDAGAQRLKKAANIALRRGSQQAKITRDSVIKPMYVPLPDPIKQPVIPQRSTFNPMATYFGGFSSGLQSDYAKGNWPFSYA